MQYHESSSTYETSYLKNTVDAWTAAKASLAIELRVVTIEEVLSLGYGDTCIGEGYCGLTENVPAWIYINSSYYWTMSSYPDSSSSVWEVDSDGRLYNYPVFFNRGLVRPVIVLSKSVL